MDKCVIASTLNDFVVNIASNLPEPRNKQSANCFCNHPNVCNITSLMQKHDNSDYFNFMPTNPGTVMEIIRKLSSSKAAGCDNTPVRLVKDGACIITAPLANLCNASICSSSSYPTVWKFGQVTPVFKKGDENLKSNYRPITLLVAFNIVFERILSMQLYNYFQDKLSPYFGQHIASTTAARPPCRVFLGQ